MIYETSYRSIFIQAFIKFGVFLIHENIDDSGKISELLGPGIDGSKTNNGLG